MRIQHFFSLTNLNTLRLKSTALYFSSISSIKQLIDIVNFAKYKNLPLLPLGEGSNVILPEIIHAVVIQITIKGKKIRQTSDQKYLVTAFSGENWHDFVDWTLEKKAYGLENLSLIPGTVGASPIQNIGAYGVEISDYLYQIEIYDYEHQQSITLDNKSCEFSYRNSIFKKKDKYIIISVTFSLKTTFTPVLNHKGLKTEFPPHIPITAHSLRNTICNLRRKRLPNSDDIGNAGSFFKNPIISENKLNKLMQKHTDIPYYKIKKNWKISAGWLIEQAGLKGKRCGNLGIYEKHALILVSYNTSSQTEVLNFSHQIKEKVYEQFQIHLEIEPTVISLD